ncbi:hypothetical protein ACPC58_08420 [Streptococcus sp. VTCC 12905]|uniref:hypothetical protein n=1 Tax=Streptococcus sp. VTCC 12905 TaxID=3413768 RepID=UPI003D9C7C3C
MNKRIKKKRELENALKLAGNAVEFLLDQNNQLWNIVEKMEKLNNRNVQATNSRFDAIEVSLKSLKNDSNILKIDVEAFTKQQKKYWFSRK